MLCGELRDGDVFRGRSRRKASWEKAVGMETGTQQPATCPHRGGGECLEKEGLHNNSVDLKLF